ncbi:MAG: acyl--CoA ligase [Actinobacteria bacterium]|nr:acyl--CoA ligase [Actinomycetota bacterium]
MILDSAEQVAEYTGAGIWGDKTLMDLVRETAARTPDAEALVDPPNRAELLPGEPRRLTYRELTAQVDNLAAALLGAGLRKDDVLMVQLPNTVEIVEVLLACARLGVICSPVPVQFRTHELRYIIPLVEPKAFVTCVDFQGHAHLEMIRGLRTDFPDITTIIATGGDLPDDVVALDSLLLEPQDTAALVAELERNPVSANDIFTVCWTSGTEADPKGVPRSHNHWMVPAWAPIDAARLPQACVVLCPFPMVNLSGIGAMMTVWILTGGKLAMHHPFNLPVYMQQIAVERAQFPVAPPVLLTLLLRDENTLAKVDLSSVICIGSGSAPLSPATVAGWQERGVVVMNFYAANEGQVLASGIDDCPDPVDRALFFPRFGAEGFTYTNRCTRGMKSRLVDSETGEVITQPGVLGELRVKGPTMFPGYWRRPDLTAKAFDEEGYFRTGDLFEIDVVDGEPSRYRFVGRLKDLIIRGGFKIAAEEIENLLVGMPAIQEAAVVGLLSPRTNEEDVCVVAVPKAGQTVTLAEIKMFLRDKDVAAYKIPRRLVVFDSLPRNALGKVIKREIREKAGA